MVRSKLSRILSLFIATFLLSSTIVSSVNAMNISTAEMYALNNILGYDGEENLRDPCGPGSTLNLDGNTNLIKIANYLSGNICHGKSCPSDASSSLTEGTGKILKVWVPGRC